VDLTWSPAADNGSAITAHLVQYRVVGTQTWSTVSRQSSDPAITVAALAAGRTYEFRVAAVNEEGTSEYSSEIQASTAPAQPVLTRGSITQRSVSFTFTADTGVSYTALARVGSTTLAQSNVRVTVAAGRGTVTISGREPAQAVLVTVTAAFEGLQATSDQATATTSAAPITVTITGSLVGGVAQVTGRTTGLRQGETVTLRIRTSPTEGFRVGKEIEVRRGGVFTFERPMRPGRSVWVYFTARGVSSNVVRVQFK
jgi:hypothetical protein